jgi:hypothetical protein
MSSTFSFRDLARDVLRTAPTSLSAPEGYAVTGASHFEHDGA